jgi:hypothetical protein
MDRGTDARNFLLGNVIPLKFGYVGVVNRSQEVYSFAELQALKYLIVSLCFLSIVAFQCQLDWDKKLCCCWFIASMASHNVRLMSAITTNKNRRSLCCINEKNEISYITSIDSLLHFVLFIFLILEAGFWSCLAVF